MLIALEQEATALGRVGAAAARELAARVAAWVPERGDDDGDEVYAAGPPTAPTVGEETYFRDRKSASFVDEVLEAPAAASAPARAARARRPAWWTAAAVVIAAAGVVAVARTVQSQHRDAAAQRSIATVPPATTAPAKAPATTSPTTPPAATSPTTPPAATSSTTPPATTSAHAAPAIPPATTPHATPPHVASSPSPSPSRHAPPHHAATTATGTLLIQCTPWCIPSVDDEVRGADGRNHRLTLPAGTHRVSVRRLDDRLQRNVEIRAGQSETVDFTFE